MRRRRYLDGCRHNIGGRQQASLDLPCNWISVEVATCQTTRSSCQEYVVCLSPHYYNRCSGDDDGGDGTSAATTFSAKRCCARVRRWPCVELLSVFGGREMRRTEIIIMVLRDLALGTPRAKRYKWRTQPGPCVWWCLVEDERLLLIIITTTRYYYIGVSTSPDVTEYYKRNGRKQKPNARLKITSCARACVCFRVCARTRACICICECVCVYNNIIVNNNNNM